MGSSNCTQESCILSQWQINGQTLLLDGMSFVSRPNHTSDFLKLSQISLEQSRIFTDSIEGASHHSSCKSSISSTLFKSILSYQGNKEGWIGNNISNVHVQATSVTVLTKPNSETYLPESEIIFIFLFL